MPRPRRADVAGEIYHALNRGNARNTIFFKDADYEAFERIIAEGQAQFPVDLLAYQWMSNHWHMVISPREDGAMSAFVGWVTLTHTQRYHAHHGTTGYGHVYQGRYKSFPVQDDSHFHTVCRYVERNALAAGIVEQAEDFRWGSLFNWLGGQSKVILASWPISRLPHWVERVNQEFTQAQAKAIRKCIQRGAPFGEDDWVEKTAVRHGLESTLRPRGRPRVIA